MKSLSFQQIISTLDSFSSLRNNSQVFWLTSSYFLDVLYFVFSVILLFYSCLWHSAVD